METIEEIRHANLHVLTSRGHSQASIGRAFDIDRRQVNQWFVTPPLRPLSSDYARRIEQKFYLERGCMDHPMLGEPASQLSRFDLGMLAKAILAVAGSQRPLTAETVAEAYGLLTNAPAVQTFKRQEPPTGPTGAAGNVTVTGRNSRTIADSGRKSRTRKK